MCIYSRTMPPEATTPEEDTAELIELIRIQEKIVARQQQLLQDLKDRLTRTERKRKPDWQQITFEELTEAENEQTTD